MRRWSAMHTISQITGSTEEIESEVTLVQIGAIGGGAGVIFERTRTVMVRMTRQIFLICIQQ